nr:MAG TPA: hypothetical protein [Caudoviricetes sp.]
MGARNQLRLRAFPCISMVSGFLRGKRTHTMVSVLLQKYHK